MGSVLNYKYVSNVENQAKYLHDVSGHISGKYMHFNASIALSSMIDVTRVFKASRKKKAFG